MKITVICSAGGSSFFQAFDLLKDYDILSARDIQLITDRDCEAIEKAKLRNIEWSTVEYKSKVQFSKYCLNKARKNSSLAVLLYYSKLVSEDLYNKIITINFHPSQLPNYKGLNSVNRAFLQGEKILGATAHLVSKDVDEGEILYQITSHMNGNEGESDFRRLSYLQVSYITIVILYGLVKGYLNIQHAGARYTAGNFTFDNPSPEKGFFNEDILLRNILDSLIERNDVKKYLK